MRTVLCVLAVVLSLATGVTLVITAGRIAFGDRLAADRAFAAPNRVVAAQDLPVAGGAAVTALADPLERDGAAPTLLKPGRWRAWGEDKAGSKWQGYLIVEHDESAFLTAGSFRWACENGGGGYNFRGEFDPQTREVRWNGFTVKDRIGTPCNARYRATLSDDGRRLAGGSWEGGVSVPGTWEAEFDGGEE
jgi:hypothetical protein